MKILLVAQGESIHTKRWLQSIKNPEDTIYLFSSTPFGYCAGLENVQILDNGICPEQVEYFHQNPGLIRQHYEEIHLSGHSVFQPDAGSLAYYIETIHPDIVHSMEIQQAGYLTLAAKKQVKGSFPIWIVSCWGNDLYLFSNIASHRDQIQEVLDNCDYFHAECERDIELAKSFHYQGKFFPVIQCTGGLRLKEIDSFRENDKASGRKYILLKGNQDFRGRALTGLYSLEKCADLLEDYKILVYLADPEVIFAAELLKKRTGLDIQAYPYLDRNTLLQCLGRSRIAMGFSMSDGVANTFLEAMALGAFPIYSNTGAFAEWIQNEKTGLLVNPEDTSEIEKALRRALKDDELVDSAAVVNRATIAERLDYDRVAGQIQSAYDDVKRNLLKDADKFVSKEDLVTDTVLASIIDAFMGGWDVDKNKEKLIAIFKENRISAEDFVRRVNERAGLFQNYEILNTIGAELWNLQMFDFVLPILQKSFEINPGYDDCLFNIGFVLTQMGDRELALKYFYRVHDKSNGAQEFIDALTK